MGVQLSTGLYKWRYVEGFIFVPQERLSEAALAMMEPGKSKYEEWAAKQHELCKRGMTRREAAKQIAKEAGVDISTVERETRRVRRERESGKTK